MTLNEEHVQSLANVLSLVAIIGRMDQAAIQRVLVSLGASLMDVSEAASINQDVARNLLAEVVKEKGEEAAAQFAGDMAFIARAWKPVIEEYNITDPYRLMPYAEILFSLINHSGVVLDDLAAFDRFGGPDLVLPMDQLTASLKSFAVPRINLKWEMIGFTDPPDQALLASDDSTIFLFKAAPSGIDIRFSELERNVDEGARREYDVRVDTPVFAAFMAGLLADMFYWTARMRSHALPGHALWNSIQHLLDVPPEL